MSGLIGRLVGLHIGYWKFDRWYRWAWYAWPQALAILLALSILGDGLPRPGRGKWSKPADCSNASNPGCAATQRAAFVFPDVVVNPTLGLQNTVAVDRSAFASSAAADQPKLTAALAAYYGSQWQRATDILKSADASDPNVQLVSALALLGQGTMDSVHASEVRLRAASAAGQRQAGAVLGRILVIGAGGVPKDEQEGRKLIENGAAGGDTYALRLNAVAYLSREFGSYDASKAADLMHKSAEAGDPFAMISYAMFLQNGLGGIHKNEEQSINYLRRAAGSGSTGAQYLLGLWLSDRYKNREIDNPSESMKWYELAYQRGYSFFALVNLAHDLKVGRSPPWFDTARSFSLLQLCGPYSLATCHALLGDAYRQGSGTPQDFTKAYAHYALARQLGSPEAANALQQLDATVSPAVKSAGNDLANKLSQGLRVVPPQVALQIAGAVAGPSPWELPPVIDSSAIIPSSASSTVDSQTGVNNALPLSGIGPHALCSGQRREQKVLFEDKFTSSLSGWDKDSGMKIADGQMEITLRTDQKAYTTLNRKLSVRSGDFCLRFTLPEPESDNGSSASLVLWASDYKNYYSVDFWSNGNLSFGQEDNGAWKEVYSIDDSSRAWTGAEQVFELRVVANNGEVKTWLNGALVRSIELRPPSGNLSFGIFLEMDKQPQTNKVFRIQYFNVLEPLRTFGGG